MTLLSICIPAFNRTILLERALRSALDFARDASDRVEIVVADDSSDPATEEISRRVLGDWSGRSQYVRNDSRLGMVGNFNRCVELANGRFVLVLHDDDFLLREAGSPMIERLAAAGEEDRVLLFGVVIVDEKGRALRRQGFPADVYLPPRAALTRLLTKSSFVRFPAIVVRRDAYAEVGPFDASLGSPTDFDMWIRLFSRFGLRCMSLTVSAYTVHEGALTTMMFDESTVRTLMLIFDRARDCGVLPEATIRRRQADWFHQFILAGAYRRLRARDPIEAQRILRLFEIPAVRSLGSSRRWTPVRLGLETLIRLPSWVAEVIVRGVDRLSLGRGVGQ